MRGHLTILPPRKLACSLSEAVEDLRGSLESERPFYVTLGEVHKFPVTNVIHLCVGDGLGNVERLHRHLDRGRFAWQETYRYEPHVTLAQRLVGDEVFRAEAIAKRKWREFLQSRTFFLEQLTLVRYAREGNWENLQDYVLRSPSPVPVGSR